MMLNQEPKTRAEAQPLDAEMAELSVLVPRSQVQALERAAQSEGISMGQYMRRALQLALNQFVTPKRNLGPCGY